MNATSESGIKRITSPHSVTTTLERLESLLKEKNVMIFARIDFSGDAGRAGLTIRKPARPSWRAHRPRGSTCR